jgi:hypothetical protein
MKADLKVVLLESWVALSLQFTSSQSILHTFQDKALGQLSIAQKKKQLLIR